MKSISETPSVICFANATSLVEGGYVSWRVAIAPNKKPTLKIRVGFGILIRDYS